MGGRLLKIVFGNEKKSPERSWSERTCVVLSIFAMTSMTWSCSLLGLLEGLSCRICNSVTWWTSLLRDQHVTHLLSQQRQTLYQLLAGKGQMTEGKGNCLPLPVIRIFIQSHIFPTCFMILLFHERNGSIGRVGSCPGRRSSKGLGHIQSRLWGEC